VEIDIVPPPAVPLRQEEHPRAAETAARLRRGDSLRALYESSFPDSARVAAFATANGFPADSCWMLLRHARGNGTEILAFLAAARDIDRVPALAFLRTLAVKDLQDAPAAVLTAHYHGALAARPFSRPCDSLYMHFVCTPRIGREELRPWRATMREAVEGLRLPHDTHARISLARKISGWVRDSVRLDRAGNWGIVPQPVTATFALRSGDPYSRRLLLVAMLRSAGFPARLHPATGAAEFHAEGLWFNAGLEEADVRPTETSTLVLRPRAGQRIQSPVYARHFTLARFADGVYRTLDFEGDERFSSWPAGVSLQPGHYMLVTGNRLADGSVLAAMEFLTLRDGQTVEHVLRIRDDDAPPVPLGRIAASLLPEGSARAHVLLWIENGTEPVSHALRDIARERSSLAEHPVSFLLGGEGMNAGELRAIASEFLPESTLVAADGSMAERASALRDVLVETMQLPAGFTLPLVAVCDAQGNITFAARGYTIGVGSQILRILERMHVRD
jgi:hypothetical protein